MNEFLDQFGIDWKLLLSQLINFSLILIILRVFLYKPLLKTLNDRKKKIEEGLAKAEESDIRLKEVDQIAKQKIKEADEARIAMLSETDAKKKELEIDLSVKIRKKEEELLEKAKALAESHKKEMYAKLQKEAGQVIRSAISKAIELEPEQIDEKLIKKTASILEASQQ